MKFSILKREVELRLDHIILVAVLYGAFATGSMLLSIALAYAASGGVYPDAIVKASLYVTTALSYVSGPIVAYLLLEAGRLWGMKRDVGFCRSVSAASFIITATMFAIFFAILLLYQLADFVVSQVPYGFGSNMPLLFPLFGIPDFAGQILGAAGGTILSYLWLLLMLEFRAERVRKAAGYAVAFAALLLLLHQGVLFAIEYSHGMAYTLEYSGSMATGFVYDFMFAFAVLYHTIGRKLDMGAAWLFAALGIGANLAYGFSDAVALYDPFSFLIWYDTVHSIVAYALLYGLSRTKDITL